ncbi:SH3 domain-containing protein [Serratia proteamaculans]
MGTVTGEKINIRSESNDQAAIIGSVTKGTELTVLYQEIGWTQIQYNQQVAGLVQNLSM